MSIRRLTIKDFMNMKDPHIDDYNRELMTHTRELLAEKAAQQVPVELSGYDLPNPIREMAGFFVRNPVIHGIALRYSGYGDSGDIEDMEYLTAFGDRLDAEGIKELVSFDDRTKVMDFAWSVINLDHGGFENNEGGSGSYSFTRRADDTLEIVNAHVNRVVYEEPDDARPRALKLPTKYPSK